VEFVHFVSSGYVLGAGCYGCTQQQTRTTILTIPCHFHIQVLFECKHLLIYHKFITVRPLKIKRPEIEKKFKSEGLILRVKILIFFNMYEMILKNFRDVKTIDYELTSRHDYDSTSHSRIFSKTKLS
jgi:hypothetical protein